MLVGDIIVEEGVNIWFGVIMRADLGRIVIGAGSNIQDGTVIHADYEGMVIGENVTVGHHCLLHGSSIADVTLIGMGATLLVGSRVGRACMVGAGALVTERFEVPDATKAWGVPATVRGQVTQEEEAWLLDMAAQCRAEVDTYY